MTGLRDEISESLANMTWVSIAVFIGLVPIVISVTWLIARSIAKPLTRLNAVTNQVAKGDLSVRIDNLHGAEVRGLGDSLNIMINRIELLLKAVREEQDTLRNAELDLIQAQINPHFLYNTLDAIIWLAEAGEKQQVVDMVVALSSFFRTSLGHGEAMVTLNQEEKHVQSYMQIQHVRYQDILVYEINIPEEFRHTLIPKITLQPLVENALYHGIKNKRGKGRIAVSAQQGSGGYIVITVADNGIGMTEERLRLVRDQLNGGKNRDAIGDVHVARNGTPFGLYSVNERLRLRFGPEYGISITSVYGEGTEVKIRIPETIPLRPALKNGGM
jgi:two-component system sensor histidine kinase YesM